MCPWPVEIHRPHFTDRNTFHIDAVPQRGAVATTIIEDNFQWEKIMSFSPSTRKTILGEEIAADLVLHTARSGPFQEADAHPAVWMCAGPEPSLEEIDVYYPRLLKYCGNVVEYADELDRRRQQGETNVQKIMPRMKDCCRFLGLKREWLTELVDSTRICPFCTQVIPIQSLKCRNCHEVVDRVRYDQIRKDGHRLSGIAANAESKNAQAVDDD